MTNQTKHGQVELDELKNRLDWMDEQRRRSNRQWVELEQRLTTWERELENREKRLSDVEEKLSSTLSQLARLSHTDTQLQIFKEEVVKLIEQYDHRRIVDKKEMEKLRNAEHELQQRDIAEIRKEITAIGAIKDEIATFQPGRERITKSLAELQNRISAVENEVETRAQELRFVEKSEQTNAHKIAEIQTSLLESSKRVERIGERLDITAHGVTKAQVATQELNDTTTEIRQSVKDWADQVQIGEYQRNKRLDDWQRTLNEFEEKIENFKKEWVKYSDQHKEAREALQTLEDFREQIEQRQREVSELTRIEANQMRARWDSFVLDQEKHLKNFEVDQEQRWAGQQRDHQQVLEDLNKHGERIEQIIQDKDALWRVQSAQNDAVKKLPRIWLEEVEKALALNPNSRRQPALIPVREE